MQKASIGGEEKREFGGRGLEGWESNIRVHENVHLVGYKVKDADPSLPVRSLVKNGQWQTHTRGLGY